MVWRYLKPDEHKMEWSNSVRGEGNRDEEPTNPFTDRSKWTSRTLVEFCGQPGTIFYACFTDLFNHTMMLDEPIEIGKNGTAIVVYGRGYEDCNFFGISDKPITAELIGYGTQV